jgi:hypothetical protein
MAEVTYYVALPFVRNDDEGELVAREANEMSNVIGRYPPRGEYGYGACRCYRILAGKRSLLKSR